MNYAEWANQELKIAREAFEDVMAETDDLQVYEQAYEGYCRIDDEIQRRSDNG